MATWNTLFNNLPTGTGATGLIRDGDNYIRETRVAVQERLIKEHVMSLSSGLSTEDGYHAAGSARAFVQTTNPTHNPNGVALGVTYDTGRVVMITPTNALSVWDGSAWQAVSGGALSFDWGPTIAYAANAVVNHLGSLYLCGTAHTGVIPAGTRETGLTADSATNNTLTDSHLAGTSVNSYYGFTLVTTGGTGSGQTRTVSSFDPGLKTLTVTADWTTNPDATTTFTLTPNSVSYWTAITGKPGILDNADYTVTSIDGVQTIYVETGNTNRTITLPVAADNYTRVLHIIKTDPAGTGAIIIDGNGTETVNGDLTITVRKSASVVCGYNGSAYNWQTLGDDGQPPGTIIASARTSATPPAGYLLCDGSAISRATYAHLFTAIGTTWGVGDGSTTFNLPNGKGVCLTGVGDQTIATRVKSGPAIGATNEDRGQGHLHRVNVRTNVTGFGDAGIAMGTNTGSGVGFDAGLSPVFLTDSTNGDPRTGLTTRPNEIGVNWFIKF